METRVCFIDKQYQPQRVKQFALFNCIFLSHNSLWHLTFKAACSFSCFDQSRKGPVIKKWICAKSGSSYVGPGINMLFWRSRHSPCYGIVGDNPYNFTLVWYGTTIPYQGEIIWVLPYHTIQLVGYDPYNWWLGKFGKVRCWMLRHGMLVQSAPPPQYGLVWNALVCYGTLWCAICSVEQLNGLDNALFHVHLDSAPSSKKQATKRTFNPSLVFGGVCYCLTWYCSVEKLTSSHLDGMIGRVTWYRKLCHGMVRPRKYGMAWYSTVWYGLVVGRLGRPP